MDRLLRFSDYDVFGTLSAGVAALALYDLIANTHFVLGAAWSVADTAVIIIIAYLVGQILSAPAAWLLERELVFKGLGRPSANLMRERRYSGFRGFLSRTILGDYYTSLSQTMRDRIHTAAGHTTEPVELFEIAYMTTMRFPLVRAKLETFLRLYGFCRNMAFVGIVATVALATKGLVVGFSVGWTEAASILWMSLAALVLSMGIFHRYLKFLRLYGVTTLTSFASGDLASTSTGQSGDDAD